MTTGVAIESGPPPGRHAGDEATWVSPASLLRADRLDIVVKYLYFSALIAGATDKESTELYTRHITRRTGGYEDTKRNPDDYRRAADALLTSIAASGFDPRHAVPVGPNGRPYNGAHRIAACLALHRTIAVRSVPEPGPDWDFEWFRLHDFKRTELDRIVRSYARLTARPAAFVFWGRCRPQWPALMGRLRERAAVIGWRDLHLVPGDVRTFIRDLYARRLGPTPNERIEAKARELAGDSMIRVVLVDADGRCDTSALEAWTTGVKRDLRALAGHDSADYFATVHATDSADEARYVADMVFNENSLRQWATRRNREDRPAFIEWLAHYRQTLDRLGVSVDDACVVGSAVLEAIGIRESTDIDCVMSPTTRAAQFHGGVVHLDVDVDLVTAGYHRRSDAGPVIDDAVIVADPRYHFLYRGLKFANPELVIDRKRQHGRPKDLADVALWDRRTPAPADPTESRPVVVRWVKSDPSPEEDAADQWPSAFEQVPVGPSPSANLAVAHILTPSSVDALPEALLSDPDPLATLEGLGASATLLHDLETRRSGPPKDAGHAFRRLRGFSWTGRWIARWLGELRPAAVVVDDMQADVEACLMASIARALKLPTTLPPTPDSQSGLTGDASANVRRICREANEIVHLLRSRDTNAASEIAEARAQLSNTAEARDTAERHLESARAAVTAMSIAVTGRPIWIWGAGSAGRKVADWLENLGVRCCGAIDRNAELWGSRLRGLHVVGPGVLQERRAGTKPFVVVASVHAPVIAETLEALGISRTDMLLLADVSRLTPP